MVNSSSSPQKGDVVLGGQSPPPPSSVVLGGIAGVKQRLASGDSKQKAVALSDALNYGKAGLEVVIEALKKESGEVQKKAYLLLKERTEVYVKQVLRNYIPYHFFEYLQPVGGHSGEVSSVAVTPDGQHLVSGSRDRTINIWDLKTGKLIHILEDHSSSVLSVAVTPDGQHIVSGSYDTTIKIWDFKTGALIHTLEGHSGGVSSVAVTPDGQHLVSGGSTIKITDLKTGALIHTLEGHSNSVNSLAVTPDGQHIVSGSWDRIIRIWGIKE